MGIVIDEFDLIINALGKDVKTDKEISLDYIHKAQEFIKDKVFENNTRNKTVQGIQAKDFISLISIETTSSIEHEHTVFTLDFFKLKTINNTGITDLVIPSFIEEIRSTEDEYLDMLGFNQFAINRLEYIKIPKSVKSIASNTFVLYRKLKTIEFEKESRLEFIGKNAFSNCENLKVIDLTLCIGLNEINRNIIDSKGLHKLKMSCNINFI